MKSGGVKIVIENLMKAFDKYSDNKFSLIESGKQFDYKPPININHIKISDLNYDDTFFSSCDLLEKKAEKLKNKIEENMDFSKLCVLHAHNINIFKNPYAGLALKFLAQEHKDDLIIIMQVHDFAEDHRPDRLKLMLECTGKNDIKKASELAFPQSSNIIYSTINTRDKNLLKNAGINEERISVFSNAINTEFFMQEPIKEERLLDLIGVFAKKNNYAFSKERKNIVYPVKLIRRKNIIEAILILKILNSIKDEWQLLITLDANSKDDIDYSYMIKDYVRKNRLPVVIGFGFEVISPNEERKKDEYGNIKKYTMPDLFSHSECIITTSILEGFGFAFIEGWLAQKQVIGRRIDFILEDFENQEIRFPGFYGSLIIDDKDFPEYSCKEQLKILDNPYFDKIKEQPEIKNLIVNIMDPDKDIINNNKKIISEQFSLKGYYERLISVIDKGRSLMKNPIAYEVDNSYLIDFFSKK